MVSDDASSSLLSIFSRKAINGIRDAKSNIAAIQSECDSTSKKDVPVDGNEIHVPDIISGDPYKITIDGYVFHVTPNTDGDNVGTLTLTNGVNFKASIVPKSSNTDLMCLYGGNSYDFIIKFTNVGNDYCTAMTYTFTTPNGITITKNEQSPTLMTKGDIQAIKPGDTKDINITIYCESISEDFEFKEIAINTVDLDNKTWEDSVSLKINKKSVTFNIKSNLAINGVVIVPSGKTYHFKTSRGWGASVFSAEIPVPKYMKDYLIVFSGASADTEAKYSFAVDKEPASDFDAHLLPELNIYWPNDTETNATPINYDQEIMAYLRMNKANYYKVRFTD
ncbi:COG1361 family protein [Treponema sp. R6D11]